MKKLFVLILALLSIGFNAQSAGEKTYKEAVYLLKSRKYDEAQKKFSSAIEKGINKPTLKMAYIYQGISYKGQKKYKQAAESFTHAIRLDPRDSASYLDRAKAYFYLKEYNKAIPDLKHALKINSKDKQAEAAYYYLGKINMATFNYKSAINNFDQLLKLYPRDAEALYLRGIAKGNILNYKGAIKDYDRAIELKPNFRNAYANRGVMKINSIPVKDKTGGNSKCIEDPCKDLLKAKSLGDTTLEDMLYLYCKKCK